MHSIRIALVSLLWRCLIRPIFWRLKAETSHVATKQLFSGLMRIPGFRWFTTTLFRVADRRLHVTRFGIDFPNPVGLAAGIDKNAEWFDALQTLGFGFIEVGTVTARAQEGNPKPVVFRLPDDRALLNRMGSPNDGAAVAAVRLAGRRAGSIIGVNIGKTTKVPNESAYADYLESFEALYPYASYFVLNVSSPNTPGLRRLQTKEFLSVILRALIERNASLAQARSEKRKPLLIKIAPDLEDDQLEDILAVCHELRLDGIIVANTTTSREGLQISEEEIRVLGDGGISGAPLTQRNRKLVATVYSRVKGKLPIIGVGGIMTAEDAWHMIRAGASLIQVHTGLIYNGPSFVADINRHLLRRLSESGNGSIEEVIGESTRTPTPECKPSGVRHPVSK